MIYTIEIELLSDLCSSSGSTNGRSIDTDICKDNDGFPYIPGKRIKGVILQAYLDYIDLTGNEDQSTKYFGEEDGECEPMHVSDAKLKNINMKASNYIYDRVQIAVEDTGITKDGSLRSLLVVKKGNKFEFELETDLFESKLKKILSLVKFIGLNRNRGFGNVKFKIIKPKNNKNDTRFNNLNDLENDVEYRYSILCITKNDLLLPEANGNVSGSVIPGSTLYGFFAYQYIKNNNLSEPMNDSIFVDIFYKNKVQFSFGFISDENENSYYPLPSCVQKQKNTTDVYRLALPVGELPKQDDNQNAIVAKFKSLNSEFGSIDLNKKELEIKDIDFQFNYHHQRDKENMGKGQVQDTGFFQYQAIAANQYFKFDLTGTGLYLKKLLKGISCLHIGKSRTAQYGTLEIINDSFEELKETNNQSKYYLAVVETPIILKNDMPESNDIDNLDCWMFMNTLNKKYPNLECYKENGKNCFSLSKKLITGFNMHWKKMKPAIYGVASESYIILENNKNESYPNIIFIGKRNNEGYGKIRLIPLGNNLVRETKLTKKAGVIELSNDTNNFKESPMEESPMEKSLRMEEKAIDDFKNNEDKLSKSNHALISRLILILRQAKDYNDFESNIYKFTDNNKKEGAWKLLDYLDYDNLNDIEKKYYRQYLITLFTLIKYSQRNKEGE